MAVDRSCRPTRFGNIDLQIALSTPPVEVHASVRPCGRAMIVFSFSFLFFDDRDHRPASIPARPPASLTVPRPARGPPGDVARPPTPRCQSPPSPSPDAHQLASAAVAPPSRRPRSPPVRRPPRRAAPSGPSPPAHQLASAAGPRNPRRCPAGPLPSRSLPRAPCRRPAGRLPQARGPAPGGMVHAHAVGHRRAWTDGARWQSSRPAPRAGGEVTHCAPADSHSPLPDCKPPAGRPEGTPPPRPVPAAHAVSHVDPPAPFGRKLCVQRLTCPFSAGGERFNRGVARVGLLSHTKWATFLVPKPSGKRTYADFGHPSTIRRPSRLRWPPRACERHRRFISHEFTIS